MAIPALAKQEETREKPAKDIFSEKGLSVIIPAYNESARILKTIRSICLYLDRKHIPYEVIVVDDGSTDNTPQLVEDQSLTHPTLTTIGTGKNRGKGAATKTGVAHAKYGFVLLTDADLSAPIENIESIRKPMETDSDIAIGSRALQGSLLPVRQPLHRRIMGVIFRNLVKALVIRGFKDTQCGFKLLTGESARKIFNHMTTEGFAYDVEMLFIGKKLGYTITEVPIAWSDSPDSKIKPLLDSARMLAALLRIRKRHRNLYPKQGKAATPDQNR